MCSCMDKIHLDYKFMPRLITRRRKAGWLASTILSLFILIPFRTNINSLSLSVQMFSCAILENSLGAGRCKKVSCFAIPFLAFVWPAPYAVHERN